MHVIALVSLSLALMASSMPLSIRANGGVSARDEGSIVTSQGCNGDSGGPLIVDGKLTGIVSWGLNGCPVDSSILPTVFSNAAPINDESKGLLARDTAITSREFNAARRSTISSNPDAVTGGVSHFGGAEVAPAVGANT